MFSSLYKARCVSRSTYSLMLKTESFQAINSYSIAYLYISKLQAINETEMKSFMRVWFINN